MTYDQTKSMFAYRRLYWHQEPWKERICPCARKKMIKNAMSRMTMNDEPPTPGNCKTKNDKS